jgi:secondary thiamine-phosphate synthase enzyme
MKVMTFEAVVASQGNCDIINISEIVTDKLKESKLREGTCTVFSIGSTASVTTIEFESGLLHDFPKIMEKLIPSFGKYKHNETWGDNNGHSHIRSSIVGTSLSLPFKNGELILGTWQQIVLIDFDDRPRSRRLAIQFMGE